MQNMHWKILIVVVALGLAIYSFLSQGVRYGKDLSGGLSLIYQLNIPEDVSGSDAQQIQNQTIEVLKSRINPKGVLDISILPAGRDRIEVIMPLPSEEVKAAEKAYQDLIQEILAEARIPARELDEALVEGAVVETWAPDADSPLRGRLETLQAAHDERQRAITAYEEARAAENIDPQELARLEQAVAEADIEFERLQADVLQTSLDEAELRRMLRLSTETKSAKDPETGKEIVLPSARALELDSTKERFPHVASELDALVEAYDRYNGMRRGLDDVEDLKRLMRGAGVLEFRIAARPGQVGFNSDQLRADLAERGPEYVSSTMVKWFPINDVKQWYEKPEELAMLEADPIGYFGGRGYVAAAHGGRYYLLLYNTPGRKLTHERGMPEWSLTRAGQTIDSIGRDAVSFELDSTGGLLMGDLTAQNLGEPMAIVLDGEVYSAPRINSRISTNGIIEGNFSIEEIQYLKRVLAAGTLAQSLSPDPIAQNILGPSIGRDNLTRGLYACLLGTIAVAIFMIVYYLFAGVVADMALLINGILIFGIMSMQNAAFTLPGIAGIVLTIGMAVDANVLIYERIREELFAGESDLRTAIRLGYQKAFSTIVDANVTNLIVCFVLYQTATAEVKGFALTLGIGILSTLFTALFVTRIVYTFYTDVFKMDRLPMLPTVFPAVHRFLEPNINWIGLRKVFIPISVVAAVTGIALVGFRGVEMYDTEFRGGVSMTFQTREATDEERQANEVRMSETGHLMLNRSDVQERVQQIGVEAVQDSDPTNDYLGNFRNAGVLSAGAEQEGSWSTSFQIKVAVDTEAQAAAEAAGDPEDVGARSRSESRVTDEIVATIVEAFGDVLGTTPRHEFRGMDETQPPVGATFPITEPRLGPVIERNEFNESVRDFDGGVAIVIEDIDPPATLEDITSRIERMRRQPAFSAAAGRPFRVIGLEPAQEGGFHSVTVVVDDPVYDYYANADIWQSELATQEWRLVAASLAAPASLEQVSSYSSSVAQTLAAGAVVAVVVSLLGILAYIWMRFGSLRYSLAAIVALVHDVCVALGLLALTHLIAGTALATALGIDDFRIDLGVVAALLTIIGYSLNDTIVILDRIRENRGKRPTADARIINRSINQTVSRTVLTSSTTLLAVLVMYIAGGTGIRPFTFTLLIGLIVGTYSSVAVAAPLVWKRAGGDSAAPETEMTDTREEEAATVPA